MTFLPSTLIPAIMASSSNPAANRKLDAPKEISPDSSTEQRLLTPESDSGDEEEGVGDVERGLGGSYKLRRLSREGREKVWNVDEDNEDEDDGDGEGNRGEQEDGNHGKIMRRRRSALSVESYKLYTPDEEMEVVRIFDRKLVLFVALLYMLSFLDRSSKVSLLHERKTADVE
jgi:hypothetical protein